MPGFTVPLLDESRILAPEAVYASILSSHHSSKSAYSPFTEFLVRTNLNVPRLITATGTLISVFIIGIVAFWQLTTAHDVSNSSPTVSPQSQSQSAAENAVQTASPIKKAQAQKTANSPLPSTMIDADKTVNDTRSESAKGAAANVRNRARARANSHAERSGQKNFRVVNKDLRAASSAQTRRLDSSNAAAERATGTAGTSSLTNGSQRPRIVGRKG